MGNDIPLLSIGLPVYNGAKYLRQSIDSILGQTLTDFELIISDNASTDETPRICREYSERDPRVRFYQNPINIGGANNANLTFSKARGKYFRMAAHDDVCAPTLLARCVEFLEANPDIVVCYTQSGAIDAEGEAAGITSRNNARSSKPHERFAAIALSRDRLEETYGVIRADVLRSTRLLQNYTASDRTLMCELSLHGPFHEIREPLFFKRLHPKNEYSSWRKRMAWFNPSMKSRFSLPFWIQLADYFKTIGRVPVPLEEKLRCSLSMVRWVRKYAKELAKDLIFSARLVIHGRAWRERFYVEGDNWS